MSILQVAGEDESWDILNGSVSTDANHYRANYARCAILSNNEDGVQVYFRGALKAYLDAQPSGDKDFWFGPRWGGGGGFITGGIAMKLYDSTDKCFMRLKSLSVGDWTLETSVLGSFGGVGDTFNSYPASSFAQAAPNGNPHELAFRVKIHPTNGHIAWYINGAFWFQTALYDTTALCTGSPKFVRFGPANSNGICRLSEFIATSADQPRVGMSLNTLIPTAAGFLSQWGGTFGDIGEVVENTSTLLQTAVAANDSLFEASDTYGVTGSIVVLAIILSGKFAAAALAPQNIAGLLRIGTTIYPSALQTVASTLELRQFIWATSPANPGNRFTSAEVDGFQYGVRSAA